MEPYKSDFYTRDNIIGYTGNLIGTPTVYFERKTSRGTEYGRITQKHDNPNNVGRNVVRESSLYLRGNRMRSGGMRYVENDLENGTRHTSRNALQPVRNDAERFLLAKSISNFRDCKPKYANR